MLLQISKTILILFFSSFLFLACERCSDCEVEYVENGQTRIDPMGEKCGEFSEVDAFEAQCEDIARTKNQGACHCF